MKIITGFLDLPSCGKMNKHMDFVEKDLGSVQDKIIKAAERDALDGGFALAKEKIPPVSQVHS